ncbi:MAG: hypothetical protein ACE5JD_10300 [Candidatus Methylomirabilia bacterium]
MLTREEQDELHRLLQEHIPIRAIARRLGRDIKTIRRAPGRNSPPPPPSKLAPYHPLVREWFAQVLPNMKKRGKLDRRRLRGTACGVEVSGRPRPRGACSCRLQSG